MFQGLSVAVGIGVGVRVGMDVNLDVGIDEGNALDTSLHEVMTAFSSKTNMTQVVLPVPCSTGLLVLDVTQQVPDLSGFSIWN